MLPLTSKGYAGRLQRIPTFEKTYNVFVLNVEPIEVEKLDRPESAYTEDKPYEIRDDSVLIL